MVRTDDELALRAALADVTVGQPDLPVDRVAGVRRRHVRRRQIQAVATAAAVAVIAAGVVLVGGSFGGHRSAQELNRPVPSWALAWDDHRDGSVPQRVLTGAVSSWADKQRADAPLPDSQPMDMPPAVWFVGERVPGTDQVLAVFEASGLHAGALPLIKGPRLVVAQASWDDVKNSTEKGSSAWMFTDVAAPAHRYGGFIGGYIPVNDVNGVHNVVWLLTSPSYRRAQTSVGPHDLHRGFTSFDAGKLRIQVEVSIRAADGSYPAGGFVGIPGAPSTQVPTLANPDPLVGVPQGAGTLGISSSQGSSVYQDLSSRASVGRPTTIYARCYSAGAQRFIRVAVDVDSARGGVRIPCDDQQHEVRGNLTATDPHATGRQEGHSVVVKAGQLTAWTVAVVIS